MTLSSAPYALQLSAENVGMLARSSKRERNKKTENLKEIAARSLPTPLHQTITMGRVTWNLGMGLVSAVDGKSDDNPNRAEPGR